MTEPISSNLAGPEAELVSAPASAVFTLLSSSGPENSPLSTSSAPRLVERFAPTAHSISPWGANLLHGGPINGLFARAMNRLAPPNKTSESRLSRVTVEILGPVTTAPLEVRAWVERPGRRIEWLVAEMWQAGPNGSDRQVARAAGWRLRTLDTQAAVHHAAQTLSIPENLAALDLAAADAPETFPLPAHWFSGFVAALQWRSAPASGTREHGRGGPTATWARLRVPLVAGEEPTALERVMTIADVANGVGARLDPRDWSFLNTEVTVHLYDQPQGEWVGVEAETSIGADGIAMSAAVLHSTSGPVGRVTQNVLVEPRRADQG
jgi:hypothetical protein